LRQHDYFGTPNEGVPTFSIFQISSAKFTTYAVFPMKSSEVGRSSPSRTMAADEDRQESK
jgi:hypothetical protein